MSARPTLIERRSTERATIPPAPSPESPPSESSWLVTTLRAVLFRQTVRDRIKHELAELERDIYSTDLAIQRTRASLAFMRQRQKRLLAMVSRGAA